MKLSINSHIKLVFVLVLGFMIPQSLTAASLKEAMIGGEIQQYMNNGTIDACGVVLFAIETQAATSPKELLGFNGSITVQNNVGMLKGRAVSLTNPSFRKKNETSVPKPLETKNIWMKVANLKATTPLSSFPLQNSEDPGYMLYGTSLDDALPLLFNIIHKRPMQIGTRISGNKFDSVLYGKVDISDADIKQLDNCLKELFQVEE